MITPGGHYTVRMFTCIFKRGAVAFSFRAGRTPQYSRTWRAIREQIYDRQLPIAPANGKTHASPNGRIVCVRIAYAGI